MSLLANITTGKQIGPQIHVLTGDNGVGKTTLASSFPGALILDLEDGSKHINVARISKDKLPTLQSLRSTLNELLTTEHAHLTVAIDSVEALEGLIFDFVCAEGKVETIEKYDGGFGKGFTRSRELMREVMHDLHALKTKGITSILVGHTQVKSKSDPATNQTYDRIIMRANDKMAAVIRDLADNVFYCTHKVFTTTENNKTKAYGDGQRVMYTSWRPGWDAKNRLDLPFLLPLSYDAFLDACQSPSATSIDEILSEITAMSERVDAGLKEKVKAQVEKYKNDPAKLKEIKNRLMTYVAA